jgi:hypothetical protein
MKQIAVTIPDNKVNLFMDLMNNLSFVQKVEDMESLGIPDWHKKIIDKSLNKYKNSPEAFMDWEDVQNELNQKYGL